MAENGDSTVDLAILGGGIVGLSVAWRARAQGMSVTVFERGACGEGATHVAAGMLAPVAEVEFGEDGRRLLEMGMRSAAMWPDFAVELEEASGTDVGLRRHGTLVVARDEDEARELERQVAFREGLGLAVERMRPSQARALEPALAPTVRLALHAPDDHSVDPRSVVAALRTACEREGVRLCEHTQVSASSSTSTPSASWGSSWGGTRRGRRAPAWHATPTRKFWGRQVLTGLWTRAQRSVLANRCKPVRWSYRWGLGAACLWACRKAPGWRCARSRARSCACRDPAGPGLIERVVRFGGGYLVPRGAGRYVLGATVEERGFEADPTAGGIYELLRDAHDLVPGVSELRIEEIGVGYRPGTPDNLPVIGAGALEGLTWATGHHRNGILLAPLTAELVAAEVAGNRATKERVSP